MEAGIDLSDCRQVLMGFLASRGVLSRSTLREVGGYVCIMHVCVFYIPVRSIHIHLYWFMLVLGIYIYIYICVVLLLFVCSLFVS